MKKPDMRGTYRAFRRAWGLTPFGALGILKAVCVFAFSLPDETSTLPFLF